MNEKLFSTLMEDLKKLIPPAYSTRVVTLSLSNGRNISGTIREITPDGLMTFDSNDPRIDDSGSPRINCPRMYVRVDCVCYYYEHRSSK